MLVEGSADNHGFDALLWGQHAGNDAHNPPLEDQRSRLRYCRTYDCSNRKSGGMGERLLRVSSPRCMGKTETERAYAYTDTRRGFGDRSGDMGAAEDLLSSSLRNMKAERIRHDRLAETHPRLRLTGTNPD